MRPGDASEGCDGRISALCNFSSASGCSACLSAYPLKQSRRDHSGTQRGLRKTATTYPQPSPGWALQLLGGTGLNCFAKKKLSLGAVEIE